MIGNDIAVDLHTHTRFSHGRGTVMDNAAAARDRGLAGVAITDHGPASLMVGLRAGALAATRAQADRVEGIRVLVGIEANIVGRNGELDLPRDCELDLVLAGLHPGTWRRNGWHRAIGFFPVPAVFGGRRRRAVINNTRAVVAALHENDIDILTHPGLYYPVDIAEVAEACARTDTLFEINSCHAWPPVQELELAERSRVLFVVNSDAHSPAAVGDASAGLSLARQARIDPSRIVNLTSACLERWLPGRTGPPRGRN